MVKSHVVDLGWCMARLVLESDRYAVDDAKLTIVSPADETGDAASVNILFSNNLYKLRDFLNEHLPDKEAQS